MKVSVVIVNFNTSEQLKDCLDNVFSQGQDIEVIVIDNASPDNSLEMVRNNFPSVKLVEAKENKGLAYGSNLGLEVATGDYILYLGSDAYPEKGVITGIAEFMDKSTDVGISTCKLVLRNGSLDMDAHRGFPTPWASLTYFSKLNLLFPKSKIFNQYFLGYKDFTDPHEIDLCISHFMFVRKKVFDEVGKWDEDFFVFGEDVDFCYRVKKAGWKIMYLPQFTAVHYKGVSVGTRKESKDISKASNETKLKMRKSTTEAMKLFYKKHYSGVYPKIVQNLVLSGIDLLAKLRNKKV